MRAVIDAIDPDGSKPSADSPGGDPLRELRLGHGFAGRGAPDATLDPMTSEALRVLLDAFDAPDGPDVATRPAHRAGRPTQILVTIDLPPCWACPMTTPPPTPRWPTSPSCSAST